MAAGRIAAIPESDAQIVDLAIDSRDVRAGYLFLALRGTKAHGFELAADAGRAGRVRCSGSPRRGRATVFPASPSRRRSESARLAGRIAARFFQWPSSQMRIVGVTGTNGKTTCAYLITQCLERLGHEAAYMGTIGWGFPGGSRRPPTRPPMR